MSREDYERSVIQDITGITHYFVMALLLAERGMPYECLLNQAQKVFDDAKKDLKQLYGDGCEERDNFMKRENRDLEDRQRLLRHIEDLKKQLLERQ